MGSYGSYGFLCVLMGSNGFLCVPLCFYVFLWFPMGFQQSVMGFYWF